MIKRIVLAVSLALATISLAHEAPFPMGPDPVAHVVSGKWVPVDPSNPDTQGRSAIGLRLLQEMENGDHVATQIDTTGWGDLPYHSTVGQALWYLRYKTTDKDIAYTGTDTSVWGLQHPRTVHDAIQASFNRPMTAKGTTLDNRDTHAWGLDHPNNVEDAIAILVTRVAALEAKVP